MKEVKFYHSLVTMNFYQALIIAFVLYFYCSLKLCYLFFAILLFYRAPPGQGIDNEQGTALERVVVQRLACHFSNKTLSTITFFLILFQSRHCLCLCFLITMWSLDSNVLKATFVCIALRLRLMSILLNPPAWTATWAPREFSKLKSENENCFFLVFLYCA